MAEEFKDDEYHFSDEGEGAIFDEEDIAPAKKSIASEGQLKRNVLIGLGILLFILFAYKFLGSLFGIKKSTDKGQAATVAKTKPFEQATPKIVTPSKPTFVKQPKIENTIQKKQPSITTNSTQDPELVNRISRLQRNLGNTNQSVNDVSDNVDELKSAMISLTDKISILNKNIQSLTEEVQMQQTQLNKMKQVKRQPKRVVRRRATLKPKIVYYIQALIPGRAWLKASNGSTITVIEGSMIGGYGKVQVIDPHQGEVILSNGTKIKFSASDT
jgi:intracellular multiplication protein IcmG